MRILLLGASGRVGSRFGRLAAEKHHQVTALVRPSTTYDPPPGVRVVRGQVTEPSVLHELLPGHDVVVSCLGLRRTSKLPWARLLSPPDLVADVTQRLVSLMPESGVRRFVLLSAGGVGGTRYQSGWLVKRMIDAGNIGVAYRDLAAAEKTLEGSRLDWLAVQPVTLTDGKPSDRAGAVVSYGIRSSINQCSTTFCGCHIASDNINVPLLLDGFHGFDDVG
mgnify:CR=1 FL=1